MPKPSFFNPLERAKWNAWVSAGETWESKPAEAEGRYIAIAESLGWPGFDSTTSAAPGPVRQSSPTAEELLEQDSDDEEFTGSTSGFGTKVSVIRAEEQVAGEKTLHDIAISGNAESLAVYLNSNPELDLDDLDEYVSLCLRFGPVQLNIRCRGTRRCICLVTEGISQLFAFCSTEEQTLLSRFVVKICVILI